MSVILNISSQGPPILICNWPLTPNLKMLAQGPPQKTWVTNVHSEKNIYSKIWSSFSRFFKNSRATVQASLYSSLPALLVHAIFNIFNIHFGGSALGVIRWWAHWLITHARRHTWGDHHLTPSKSLLSARKPPNSKMFNFQEMKNIQVRKQNNFKTKQYCHIKVDELIDESKSIYQLVPWEGERRWSWLL